MGNKRVSQFTTVNSLCSDDIFLINQKGTTSTVGLSTLKNEIANNSQFSLGDATDGQYPRYDASVGKWKPADFPPISIPIATPEFYSLSAGRVLLESYYFSGTSFKNTQYNNNTWFNLLTAMENPKGLSNPWLNYFTATPKKVILGVLLNETQMYNSIFVSNNTTIFGTYSASINSSTLLLNGKRYVSNFIGSSPNNTPSTFYRVEAPVDDSGNLYFKITMLDSPTYAAWVFILG
jgi:hypothetical protein